MSARPVVELLFTPPLNTVQDLGRPGLRRYGVGASGAMDPLALRAGNALLGNEDGAAGIEVQTFPFRLRFLAETSFAVTGAQTAATLDGAPLLPWWSMTAKAGQELVLNPPREGARAYVAIGGGLDVPERLGSRSTQLRGGFGGHEGRWLREGDVLAAFARSAPHRPCGALPAPIALPLGENGVVCLRVMVAAEYERFSPEMQARFWDTEWRITPQSDRTGYRLSGPPLLLAEKIEMRSYGLVPGIVQVPPAGEPIVQMADANTAGGYPRLASIIDADLWRLAQARIGARIRFQAVSFEEAVAAEPPLEDYIARLRHAAALYRGLPY